MDSMRMKQLEHLEVKKGFLENELENIAQEMDECKNDPELWEDVYCSVLDENYPIEILDRNFQASKVLRELDPISYSIGLSDWFDSFDVEDTPQYVDLQLSYDEIQNEIEEIEIDIEELREEIENN